MTAEDPAYAHEGTSNDPIFFNCLDGIRRTCWDKTTGRRQKRGNKILVAFHQIDEHCLGDFPYFHVMRHDNKQNGWQEVLRPRICLWDGHRQSQDGQQKQYLPLPDTVFAGAEMTPE
jgi:hypothetical protein